MNSTQEVTWLDYDYVVLLAVPHVHLYEAFSIGVILHARRAGFLHARFRSDWDALQRQNPALDTALLERFACAYKTICAGDGEHHPVSLLPPSERFHWLTAPRSAVVQPSDVHGGRTTDPEATLDHLFRLHVERRR